MVSHHNMKNKKRGSAKFSGRKVGTLKSKKRFPVDYQKVIDVIGSTSTPKTSAASMSEEQAQHYKEAADELYWKSKRMEAIIRNLREALIMAGVEVSLNIMDPTYNGSRSTLAARKVPTIYETGPLETSQRNSDYEKMVKDFRTTKLPGKLI